MEIRRGRLWDGSCYSQVRRDGLPTQESEGTAKYWGSCLYAPLSRLVGGRVR